MVFLQIGLRTGAEDPGIQRFKGAPDNKALSVLSKFCLPFGLLSVTTQQVRKATPTACKPMSKIRLWWNRP